MNMSDAFAIGRYSHITGIRLGLLYDLSTTEVSFSPGGRDELEALEMQMWRLLYPYEVVSQCRKP